MSELIIRLDSDKEGLSLALIPFMPSEDSKQLEEEILEELEQKGIRLTGTQISFCG